MILPGGQVCSGAVTITVPGKTSRRFDLVYWVNGLPLVVVELKSPTAESRWADAAREVIFTRRPRGCRPREPSGCGASAIRELGLARTSTRETARLLHATFTAELLPSSHRLPARGGQAKVKDGAR